MVNMLPAPLVLAVLFKNLAGLLNSIILSKADEDKIVETQIQLQVNRVMLNSIKAT